MSLDEVAGDGGREEVCEEASATGVEREETILKIKKPVNERRMKPAKIKHASFNAEGLGVLGTFDGEDVSCISGSLFREL